MRISLRTFIYILLLSFCISCTFTKQIKNGETAIDRKQYRLAIEFLEEEFADARSQEESARKAYLLGQCYTMVNEVDNAAQWYDEAVRLEFGPEAYWALANSTGNNGFDCTLLYNSDQPCITLMLYG